MRSSLTRYTMRCSCVSRRDHVFGARYFNGSGLPTPSNGSRTIASMMSKARRATLRSVSTQCRRSSRNSGWNTASRSFLVLLFFIQTEVLSQFFQRLRLQGSGLGPAQRFQQTLGVFRRAQKMRGLQQTNQFRDSHESHIVIAAAADDDYFPVFGHLFEKRSKIFTSIAVSCLNRHVITSLVQNYCTK